jgi:hypothetical protein
MPPGTARKVQPDASAIEGDGFRLVVSGDYVVVEDYWLPTWIEITVGGDDGEPITSARVEVRDEAGPMLVDLHLRVPDVGTRGIRQADLRQIEVSAIAEDLVAGFVVHLKTVEGGLDARPSFPDTAEYAEALKRIIRMRSGKATREITPQLLQRVAEIYRTNIHSTPTKAVQRAYQVSPRMAAEYVSQARKRGFLPPTKRGKKMA